MTIDSKRMAAYAADPAAFRADLIVEAGGALRRLGDVLEPWQDADFRGCDPGWMSALGRPTDGPIRSRAYLERPRGHSKTSDLAVMVAWALAFSPRIIRGYAAAADRDQARLLRDAVAKLLRLNPWLGKILEVQNYTIKIAAANHPGRDSQLEVLSNDVGSSYGLLPDFIIGDELTHWGGSGDLWHSLISSAAKRATCMVVVISNAGTGQGESWQWKAREHARTDPHWHFSRLDGPRASWINQQVLDEQRRLLPGAVYQRLWLNQWVSGGDALDGADVEAAVTQDGPMTGSEPGWQFVAGLDLGTKHDRSALVVLGVHRETQRIRLAACRAWAPGPDGRVDLDEVRAGVLLADQQYRLRGCYYDPHQAALMAQQLQRAGVHMEETVFVGRNLHTMASALLEAFRSRRIDLYHELELIRDLSRLCIVERSFGWKLEAARTGDGHADRAIALAIALPQAIEVGSRRTIDLKAWVETIDKSESQWGGSGAYISLHDPEFEGAVNLIRGRC